MRLLTNPERLDMLHAIMATEPTISVNSETYRVSVREGTNFVVFFAVNERHGTLNGIAKVTRATWEEIHAALPMAYLYNTVLEQLEEGVSHGCDLEAYAHEALRA